ncbi:phosphatidylinositol-specific phospholipase [Grosmannia clavigera kw1407]|uniref:Phosphatidylinositol-specific phospholipase n=1 Tax=Grosmannia clavigera (strain kw1407 / UAMH 11150) TaxID=655863 RepID=F0XI40_GROCL|nr:phosphatidylinositol-specific phospholipase [Grosmannia clavigera kw1407]EFX02585.1 phosphatidylinositol-specific phospholipase [Grosmannia clavigera kw1407]
MAWLPHGCSSSGHLFGDGLGESATVPAVATYRGRLWCLWTDLKGQLWYAHTGGSGNDEQFSERRPLPLNGLPVLANLNGVLHVLIVQAGSGEMAHFVRDDDDTAMEWASLGTLDTTAGFVAHSTPAVVAFHNKLFLAFLRDGQLYFAVWAALGADAKTWTAPQEVDDSGAATKFRGIPALCVIDGVLHLLCGADTEERHIIGYRYDYIAQTWAQSDDVSEGRAASGVSAVSFGRSAYLGIIEAGPGDESHAVYVAAFNEGVWEAHEQVAGASAADPPQIAILNGRVHCIFNDNTATRDLRWYSRPVLKYGLSSWMAGVDDDRALSDLTIPGTHDSCARSNIPFVRTQYLSVAQQLALGIRFLDLRLRRHKNGKLYCYHGGIPIDYPRYLSFETVMDEIWKFLWPAGQDEPTETVLVSINNDDTSDEQKANPDVFYGAVADAVAATPPWPGNGQHRWHVEPLTPRLGDVRGRAVLLRRYAGDPTVAATGRHGLDLSTWKDDNPDFTIVTPTRVRVRLQDKWKYAERIALHDLVGSKASFVQQMMANAAGQLEATPEEQHDWYVNFCSAVGDPVEHGEIAESKWIAVGAHSDFVGKWVPGMNVQTSAHLQEKYGAGVRARLGIVNLDYPELPEDNDLVARLIETNLGTDNE